MFLSTFLCSVGNEENHHTKGMYSMIKKIGLVIVLTLTVAVTTTVVESWLGAHGSLAAKGKQQTTPPATTPSNTNCPNRPGGIADFGKPHVFGKVTGFNGTTILVTPQAGPDGASTVTSIVTNGSTTYLAPNTGT